MELNRNLLEQTVKTALEEDIGLGDVTSQATVPENAVGVARIWAKQSGVVAGLEVARSVFMGVDSQLAIEFKATDGETVGVGQALMLVQGSLRSILTAERTALNFLQRLSGVATRTASLVHTIRHTGVRVIDTRKTTPGLRMLEKYAVAKGGGANHRWALDSGVLIKDNHIMAAGGVSKVLAAARSAAPHSLTIEIECKEIAQVREAVEQGADVIMLDNMRGEKLLEALAIIDGRCKVEVSGGIHEGNIQDVALPGVDWISVGALTHSVIALDISLDIQEVKDE